MKKYKVITFTTGCFSGTLHPEKLQQTLNAEGSAGWRLVTEIAEEKRVALIFRREAHFLILEQDV